MESSQFAASGKFITWQNIHRSPHSDEAQGRLRHKCSKVSYQVVFWFIVVIFQIVAADVMLDQRLSQALMRYLAR